MNLQSCLKRSNVSPEETNGDACKINESHAEKNLEEVVDLVSKLDRCSLTLKSVLFCHILENQPLHQFT